MKKYIIPFAFCFCSLNVAGQVKYNTKDIPAGRNEQDKFRIAATQKEFLLKMYYQTISTSAGLIDGKEYFNYAYKSKNSPLLFSAKIFNAVLFMDGREYKNIQLQYDTYIDEIIYSDTSRIINYQYPRIVLKKNTVDSFILINRIDSMVFKNLRFLNDSENKTDGGYYEVVYNGPSRYLIKHKAILYSSEAQDEYKYSPENLILKDGVYHKIKNNKDLLNLFSSRSREINSFLHRNKIKVRKADKYEIAETLKYFDSLVNKQ